MAENQSTVENAKEKLDRWLKDGIITPGGKLPSERELGELLGIKRMTLRQALLNLEAESKIFRKDRKGWFVTQPRFNYSPELSASFQRAAIEQGRKVLPKRDGSKKIDFQTRQNAGRYQQVSWRFCGYASDLN